ncbi:MAG: phage recombination protein Bet [Clostridia bacterium]|nr:phage recombination protein Bet [Clostridia bacterium]
MGEVVAYNAGFSYTQEQIELIKNTIAKGATDDELKMFTAVAQKYGLDPFIKEIWFIKRVKKVKGQNGQWDYPRLSNGEVDYKDAETLIMTSRDGYLKIAQRDSDFDGIVGFVIRENDTFEVDAENYKVTHKFGAKRGKIIGAWAKVDHKKRKPVIVYADFEEYRSESNIWKQYPSAMILKVAEVLALKRQFGISGLVTREEMSHSIKEDDIDDAIEIRPEESREQSPEAKCEAVSMCECGKEIKGTAKASQKEIIDYALENYGRELCAECMTELAKLIKKIDTNKAAIMKQNNAYTDDNHNNELQSQFGKDSSKKLTVEEAKMFVKYQTELIAGMKKSA